MCAGCRAAVAPRHRVVGLPCGRRHVMQTRYVVDPIGLGGSPAQLMCGTRGCTAHHGRRGSLEAAVQADPGLPVTVEGLETKAGQQRRRTEASMMLIVAPPLVGIARPLDDFLLTIASNDFLHPC